MDCDQALPIDRLDLDRVKPLPQFVDLLVHHGFWHLGAGGHFVDDALGNQLRLHVVARCFARPRTDANQLADQRQRDAQDGQRQQDLQQRQTTACRHSRSSSEDSDCRASNVVISLTDARPVSFRSVTCTASPRSLATVTLA